MSDVTSAPAGRPREARIAGGLARAALLRLERILAGLSPGFVVVFGLLLLALIGLVDAVTGPFEVAVFYLVPVGLVTYCRGRWLGVAMAGVAAIAWGVVEVATGVTTVESRVTYVNALTRFYVFEAVSLLVAPMRDVVLWERELAEREAAAAEQLRALAELRDALEHQAITQGHDVRALAEMRRTLQDLHAPTA
ncbi:hypothetical protein HRbin12_00573 [bacterium HR12]|nr:hypothetical protein HRbin12_00573 [bacterium HR12]